MEAILLISHGSRSQDAYKTFLKVSDEFQNFMNIKVFPAFMEFNEPNIKKAIDEIYKQGIKRIIAIPYFLYTGIHIKEDIPNLLKEVANKYKDLTIEFTSPIEYHPFILEILKERFNGERKII
ncbi:MULTISPECIES: sirohydrochlorin chelatase [Caloramator]|jgi:sirohydrochlorin cobaltochelatase|uniref:Sirohydrochlorin cobaltochelatase n=1 Tax=Caloramator australicus RC3 TaxID=857293 RepID=I7K8S5_9CLOT|nr:MULTISPECIES: CbiX/SirB N-terminal domain-containing protein [Caloramator]MDO6353652.1 CbiX/SirB N-terminal domain-containing protein [Caloramator sp. CAR-1]CCJ33935.1 Sirohydrochlorin cobaltochelatase [Caloramator australicus RC3]